jgi:hypothetical protein
MQPAFAIEWQLWRESNYVFEYLANFSPSVLVDVTQMDLQGLSKLFVTKILVAWVLSLIFMILLLPRSGDFVHIVFFIGGAVWTTTTVWLFFLIAKCALGFVFRRLE